MTASSLNNPTTPMHRRARVALIAFVLTFLASRVLVLLIMTRRLPGGLFFHVGGTHVHHLNYGIALLCVVAGWALLSERPLVGRSLRVALLIYGVGLGMTFDEFGMWLHLTNDYWQRASYDAVVLVSSLLALLAFAPSIARWHTRHWTVTLAIALATLAFGGLVLERLYRYGATMGPWLQQLEINGPQ